MPQQTNIIISSEKTLSLQDMISYAVDQRRLARRSNEDENINIALTEYGEEAPTKELINWIDGLPGYNKDRERRKAILTNKEKMAEEIIAHFWMDDNKAEARELVEIADVYNRPNVLPKEESENLEV